LSVSVRPESLPVEALRQPKLMFEVTAVALVLGWQRELARSLASS
jgi:hypothetical protein